MIRAVWAKHCRPTSAKRKLVASFRIITLFMEVCLWSVSLLRQLERSSFKLQNGSTWVAQSVKRLTSAQSMISQLVSSSPTSGFALTAQSLEPAWFLSLPLSALPCSRLHVCARCISFSKIKKLKKNVHWFLNWSVQWVAEYLALKAFGILRF